MITSQPFNLNHPSSKEAETPENKNLDKGQLLRNFVSKINSSKDLTRDRLRWAQIWPWWVRVKTQAIWRLPQE